MAPTILVLGATGTQGRAVVEALLEHSSTSSVHVLIRNPDSSNAQSLVKLSRNRIKIFAGDFEDASTIAAAAEGAVACFINTTPSFTDPTAEARHIQNILSALASTASIRQIVYSSVASAADPSQPGAFSGHPDMVPGNLPYHFFLDKWNHVQAVQAAAEDNHWEWTILQPGMFLTNFLEPMSSLQFPELKERKIKAMLPADTTFCVVDPGDIGKVAAKVLLGEVAANQKLIGLANAEATLREVLDAMGEVADVEIEIEQVNQEEAKQSEDFITKVMSGIWVVDEVARAELGLARQFGIEPVSLKEFFKRKTDEVKVAIGLGGDRDDKIELFGLTTKRYM